MQELAPADLLSLPAEWLTGLQQAADEVDTEMASVIIDRVREHDRALADRLAELVANYRFDKLQLLMQEVSIYHDSVKHS